ncbi:MAG: tRNA (adenosine(37)-N6)-dimethylallyltransferase MiaA [Gammaproteobacteria bacterium]
MEKKQIICLMGPTAAGKTPLAIELVQQLPCDIVSVDSAMVYRDMDIGTAKPDAATLKIAPHRLIDIRDPLDAYSAGQFREDALQEIENILAQDRIPLLVGGTMLYFRVLQQGIANLPRADAALRAELEERAAKEGWESLHNELTKIDIKAAARIHPNDSQRIQRALEVYQLSGHTITEWQETETNPLDQYSVLNLAIAPSERAVLHQRIEQRFNLMLKEGFIEEVEQLYRRGDLSVDLPSIRSVGYRQVWEYLAGNSSKIEMQEKAIAATRQLAKRQLTWLRSWPDVYWLESGADDLVRSVIARL